MSEVTVSPIRTHHVTLPLCVSSFNDHAGCQGTINTKAAIIKCDCVTCHGDEAIPAAICAGCHASMPIVIYDGAISVGERTAISRGMGRYCAACHAEFLQDLKDEREARP